ncbi:glycosyltransferase [Geotalea daltonii FRC-32]|uniref:Glycosyltransferase n=1 Tax=Geotalea daltonii (strain DSM 22248 / JCM 15807 / FRC-32) TaxID=316067 RepID=B9M8X3_GEODF|nr:glycosyltransferase family 2 protein [Geotalea daltonii]ACM20469.1 glycosyltransferase [Geotalea daltonii FRC-32]
MNAAITRKISVIVPTYNRPDSLWLCLLSLSAQSVLPDEVLIADDGSGDETKETIEKFKASSHCPFSLKHVWQEDAGFRKPRIINETVRTASGDYLVFIDGDCLAHRHFVKSHIMYAEPKAVLGGKRAEIGKELTEQLLRQRKLINSIDQKLIWDGIFGSSRKIEEAIRIKSPMLRRLLHRDRICDDGIWGCNFSISKEDFYLINGSDEDFQDGSIEDNDLGIRLLNNGGKVKSVRALAIVFHLWHKSSWSFSNEKYIANHEILKRRIALKEPRCINGIVKATP